jgi:hypothetical protein
MVHLRKIKLRILSSLMLIIFDSNRCVTQKVECGEHVQGEAVAYLVTKSLGPAPLTLRKVHCRSFTSLRLYRLTVIS